MITNTVVLVIVAAMVALVLAGVVAGVRYKLRAERRLLGETSILAEVAEDARLAQLQDGIVNEATATAQVAQVDTHTQRKDHSGLAD